MSLALSNQSEGTSNEENRVNLAAGIVAGSQKVVGVAKAMELVGFSVEEIKSMKLYQQVRRKAQKLCVVEKVTPPPPAVDVPHEESLASSLTGSTPKEDNLEEETVGSVR